MKRRALVVSLLLLLNACEQPTQTKEKVAARVGDAVVDQAELNSALARLGPLTATEREKARNSVLSALVDQQLVAQAARKERLDQAPDVARAMQQAQRQVLVEAYMDRLFKTVAAPTEAEVNDYYTRHPELFAQRRLYRMQELSFQAPPDRLADVKAQLKQSATLADFAAWMKAQGIEARGSATVRPAEQIAAPVLAALATMQNGQVALVPTGEDGVSVVQLQATQLQPVTLAQARAAIEQVLQGEKRKTLMESELSRLRATGKVEYASGFAPAAVNASTPGHP